MQIIEKQSYISLQVDDCGKSSHGHWEVVPLYESSPCRRGMVPGDLLLHGFFALFPCTHLLWYVKLISEMWLKIVTYLLFEHLLVFFHVILPVYSISVLTNFHSIFILLPVIESFARLSACFSPCFLIRNPLVNITSTYDNWPRSN